MLLKVIPCVLAFVPIMSNSGGEPKKIPISCDITLNSGAGGRIDVVGIDSSPEMPSSIVFWHPPAVGDQMDLLLGYESANLKGLGSLRGVRVKFYPGPSTNAAQFQALFSTGNAQAWRFNADPDFGPDEGDFIISTDDNSGRAVTDLINKGESIKVVILKDGKALGSTTFDTKVTVGRDELLESARHIVETNDHRFCHPE